MAGTNSAGGTFRYRRFPNAESMAFPHRSTRWQGFSLTLPGVRGSPVGPLVTIGLYIRKA
jgi:hypothetical protein